MNTTKFYQTTWFTILMLIIFFPVGIFLMWKYNRFNQTARLIISTIFALAILGNMNNTNTAASKKAVELTREQLEEEEEVDSTKSDVEKMKSYLEEYEKYNKIIEESNKKLEQYNKAKPYNSDGIMLVSPEEQKNIEQWNKELQDAKNNINDVIAAAADEGINLKTEQAVENTKALVAVEEKQLKIAEMLNTETIKNEVKTIANRQQTIQLTKNLIETYQEAEKGTSDWIEAEKQLSELFPEFSTLNGIKIDGIEDSINATEKQNKAEWILFKDTIKRNKDLLESEHIKQEAIIKGARYSILSGKTLSEEEEELFKTALSNNKALMESLDQYNIWEKITSSGEIFYN